MEKGLFAKELTKRAYMISQIEAWIKEAIDGVATPGSEVHELLEEVVKHKLGGSQKINMCSLYSINDDNRTIMVERLRQFGFIVNVYDEDDIVIELIGFKVPEKQETVFLHQLELTFSDIAKEFEQDAGPGTV